MTEQESSGAPAAAAEQSAPPPPAATAAPSWGSESTAVGAFGATRGSGLARGKRHTTTTQPDSQPKTEYKPTSIELVTPAREYSNPFASEVPADVPAPAPAPVETAEVAPVASPAPVVAATPAVVEAPAAVEAAAVVETPAAEASEPIEAPAEVASAEKPEIKILPPERQRRESTSWENTPGSANRHADTSPSRDTRPVFKVEPRAGQPRPPEEPRVDDRKPEFRRDGRRNEPRDGRFEPRRDDRRNEGLEPRRDRPQPSAPVPAKPTGGFFGWLKGLFGSKPAAAPQPEISEGQARHGGQGGGRRHGRGRGRGGEGRSWNQGGQSQGQGDSRRSEGSGDRDSQGGGQGFEGGHRRRRRGRGRGRGGDHGGPRSEGQQGGGAI